MGKESTKDKWSEKGSRIGAKIGAKIGSGAYHAKKGAEKVGKEVGKRASKISKDVGKQVSKATKKATVVESTKITNIKYHLQQQKIKVFHGSCIHCMALVDAYESLLIDCVDKKLVRGIETCNARIAFDSYNEDEIAAANKIIHLLDRIKINLEFIKNALNSYAQSDVLLGKNDEAQIEMYGKYILSIKKIIYEDDNVKMFDWTHLKTKDRFRNFKSVDALLEKLAKMVISMKQTCSDTVDCIHTNISRFWNKRLHQLNKLTGGALGYIQQQQSNGRHQQQYAQQLKAHIQQIRKKQQRRQSNQQVQREKQRLRKERQAIQEQNRRRQQQQQYRLRLEAQEQQRNRLAAEERKKKKSSKFASLMDHVPSHSSSNHYYHHYGR